ncbi:MAG: acyl-CoA dehydrogenase family protein [Porticoccaceae bacterium]
MADPKITGSLDTHKVDNQAGAPPQRNLVTTDPLLQRIMAVPSSAWALPWLTDFGELMGRDSTLALANAANRFIPQLHSFDGFGRRVDEVEYHPAYHQLMAMAIENGVHSVAWTAPSAGHKVHAALEYVFAQVEGGVCCPLTMTYAALPVLKKSPPLTRQWQPKLLANRYDGDYKPYFEKAGVTLGMAMTEKQGGSDLRSNATAARHLEGDLYALCGHKWFCSAPMSDGFLTLANAREGLSCFLVPRWRPNGERNPFYIQRLKDKLGNRSNASAEIEYKNTWGYLVGEPGRGIATIMAMVKHTRLDTCVAPVALMRQAFVHGVHNARHRRAFGKTLINQPLMATVLADLGIELEAAMALVFAIAESFDDMVESEDEAFTRLAAALGKFLLNKLAPAYVCECLELFGGNGYVEDSVLPRLYREAPLNSIWEGSGNVICLDVLRSLSQFPRSLDIFMDKVSPAISQYSAAATLANVLTQRLRQQKDELVHDQASARYIAQSLARLWQCALLATKAENTTADLFYRSRLDNNHSGIYGATAMAPGLAVKIIDGMVIDSAVAQG